MSPAKMTIIFGASSSLLYLAWAYWSSKVEGQEHMAVALTFYSLSNVAIMWPILRGLWAINP